MPTTRYVALIDAKAIADFAAQTNARAAARIPTRFIPEGTPIPSGMRPVHRFDAPDDESARRYFEGLRSRGVPDGDAIGDASGDSVPGAKLWRYRGDVSHIKRRLGDIGLPAGTERAIQSHELFRRITRTLGQLQKTYYETGRVKVNGVAALTPQEREAVAGSLAEVEAAVSTLALLAAAAIDAADPAHRAFGFEHRRRFRVAIDDGPTPDPAGPVGAGDPTTVPPQTNDESNPAGGRRRSK